LSRYVQIRLSASNGHSEERRVICWEWKGNARDEGDAAAQWVSDVIGEPSRLVRFIGEPIQTRIDDNAIGTNRDIIGMMICATGLRWQCNHVCMVISIWDPL